RPLVSASYTYFEFSDCSFFYLTASTSVSLYLLVLRPPVVLAIHSFASLYDKPDFLACSFTASISVPTIVRLLLFSLICTDSLLCMFIIVYTNEYNTCIWEENQKNCNHALDCLLLGFMCFIKSGGGKSDELRYFNFCTEKGVHIRCTPLNISSYFKL